MPGQAERRAAVQENEAEQEADSTYERITGAL